MQQSRGTLIFLATQSGKWSVVELLLNYGANIDAQDKEGRALLCLAVSGNNLDIVQLVGDCDSCYILRYKNKEG